MAISTPTTGEAVQQLDCADFAGEDPIKQNEFCLKLVDSLSTLGFFKVINHGISVEEIKDAFEWSKKFFDLPLETKLKVAHPAEANPHRGYSIPGQEKVSQIAEFEKGNREAVPVFDMKESFDYGPAEDERYANKWPDETDLPGFRTFMEPFFYKCDEAHIRLLKALSIGLGVNPTIFMDDSRQQNGCELRLTHYPACDLSNISPGATRISEHKDFGTLTLLFQDSVGGLEVESRANPGSHIAVESEHMGEMIVNIGDCLQRWTNDKLRSTVHRVVLPPGTERWADARYSVAYFGKPNRSQLVGTKPEFLPEGTESKYSNITAFEYNQERLGWTY
ncbi:hypothetical protein BKA67DRAFT_522559 [Truncatella angustata]|uniref:Fe2OG dioxygenase domain-containing protein n=1 Tax=Truncatella angustata TaxID=152316 RepID=A0A9P8ZVY7_9PEZI|nr:uncharacterized protein BKA67DRAFT_522559 [Truncatella angustata]KAH6649194.1 hypothetical protein BKA67DRAFT_522559 [Truncatella angustata]